MKIIKIAIIALTVLAVNNTIAQETASKKKNRKEESSTQNDSKCFDENTHIINLGVGFGGARYYSAYRGYGYSYKISPAFSVSYEQAFHKKLGPGYLGLGAYVGYQYASSTYNYLYNKHGYYNNYYYKNSWNNFMLTTRGVYHWDVLNFKNAEVYAGVLAGIRIQTTSYETNNPDPYADNYYSNTGNVFPAFSIFAGARWYFVSKVALFGEVGYGISYVNGGVSFKF
jgi:hypothetical protein